MRITALIWFFALSFFNAVAQELSPEAQKIKNAYELLLKDQSFPENQLFFIRSFPATKDDYIEVFGPHSLDQLYFNAPAYLAKFNELAKMYPRQVLPKSIAIGKKLTFSTGPAEIMQRTIMEMANIDAKAFAAEVNKLTKKERLTLITFLANVPDHNNYPEYQKLIRKLEKIGETKIADMLIAAKPLSP